MFYLLNKFEKALAHFNARVDIIIALQIGGKISSKTAYKQIRKEWKLLKKARKALETKQP